MKTQYLFLVFLIQFISIPLKAYIIDGIAYEIDEDDNTAYVTYNNSYVDEDDEYRPDPTYSGNIIIKSEITYWDEQTYPVTRISYDAFIGSGITSVTIPNSIKNIYPRAFDYCNNLTSVIVKNETPISIHSGTFPNRANITLYVPADSKAAYESANYWKEFKEIVEFITFEDSKVEAICLANWDTNGDGYLTLSEAAAVTDLGDVFKFKSFSSFDELQYFTGLTTIGDYTFYYCSGLTSITIPESVTSIGEGAFSGCSGLTSITIPDGVTSIGERAFSGCSGLTSITIPASVTSIGNAAFYDCTGLTRAEFASTESLCNIKFEDYSANPLYYAHHLYIDGQEVIDLVIPNSVTSIGDYAFYNCSGLTSITIPESVTSIGDEAFRFCSGLTKAEFASIERLCCISFEDNFANPLYYANHLYIDGQEVKDLVIPNSVTSIGESALYNCSGLTSITIPNSVTSIGKSALYNCSGLTSITIPNSVTSIGEWAFSRCSGLTSITIPESVTSIGEGTFRGCSGLTSITIPNSVTSIGERAFYGCSSLTSVAIPNSVTSIGEWAFYDCTSLTSITIPNSVTSIGKSAFLGCSSLTSVNALAETPSSIQSTTFPSIITKIRVPEAAVSAYKAATNWSEFSAKIIALGGEDNSITVEEIEENKAAGGSANQTYIVTDAAADDVKAADNVIVHSGDNYTCANLVLSDGEPFETMAEEFTATAATYTRNVSVSNTSGTICVPYAFAKEDGVKYYTVDNTRSDDATIYLSEISGDIVPAATPVIYIKDGGKTTMTFSGSNAVAKKAAGTGSGTFELRGTFEKTTITESDELAKSYALSGGKFLCSTTKLTINPFRAYLYNTGAVTGARLNLSVEDDDEPTGITSENVALMSGDAEIEGYYTLEGKRVGSLQKGVVTVIRYANGKSVKVIAQ